MKKYDTSERPDLDALERKAEQHIKSCSSRWTSARDKWMNQLRLIDYIRHLELALESIAYGDHPDEATEKAIAALPTDYLVQTG